MIKQLGIAGVVALLAAPAWAADPGGFYVGIGGGINYTDHSDVDARIGATSFKINNVKSKVGFAANAFAGYSFGFPRVELELVYRDGKTKNVPLLNSRVHAQSGAAMVNMLFDFFPNSVVSPYIGFGAGAAYVHVNKPGKGDGDIVPAGQGIAGANLKLTPNWVVSADYRYFRTIDPQMKSGGVKYDFDYVNHTGMLGLTYRFVQPPRPVAVQPVVQTPPPPTVTRNYMVFFDFDKSEVTPQALAIIREAAGNARAGAVQRLNVTGHTDRAGTEQYNLALSLRRANAVKDSLIREGLTADQIVVIGKGETQPLVPTADGVREAQNRRVEIVLQ